MGMLGDVKVLSYEGEARKNQFAQWVVDFYRQKIGKLVRDDGLLAIRSTQVIVVGKRTGKIHYDGSANEEG